MSNRVKSKQEKLINRFGKMAEGYQEKINNQQGIINRLMKALAISQDALYGIENEAKDVREARKWAKQASAKMVDALKVEKEEGQ